jgi:hypothetical protein
VNAAVERLVNRNRLGVGFKYQNLMVLETAHGAMSVVTAGTEKVGTIIATRDRLLLALTRSTHECSNVDRCQIQDVSQDEMEGQRRR